MKAEGGFLHVFIYRIKLGPSREITNKEKKKKKKKKKKKGN